MAELDTNKINEILNYYGLKTNIEETKKWVKKYVGNALTGITTDLMISGTYKQIKGWRDNGKLRPGMLYRMTDYVTKVYSEDGSVSSAEHPFDLILFANTTDVLNENAFAIVHDGDEYFSKIKYNKTYYRWQESGGSNIPYYILTERKVYTNIPDGTDDYGDYYLTTYPIDKYLTIDDEEWEIYSKWARQEKSILYTDGDTLTIGSFPSNDETGKWYYDQEYYFVDTYEDVDYRSAKLNAWEIKYSLDNDIDRFEFADAENGKGVIYYMKDEFNNEAPYDFKNILQNDGDYTFGKLDEDYSLNGYVNGVYNNKILPQVDSETSKHTINKIRVTGKNCHSNLFKPTCVNSYINFNISECDISMNGDGELVIFKTSDFVSGIENHTIDENPLRQYLTFEAVNDDTEIIFKTYTDDSRYTRTIEVSKDKVNWESKTSSSEGVMLGTLNAGEKLYLRGNNNSYGYYYEDWDETLCNFILPLDYCYVYGNVMSLIRSTGFASLTELTEDYTFYSLFCDSYDGYYMGEYLLSHSEHKLVLPATTLASYCYSYMFNGCTSLVEAPVLPATTLANYCYQYMFYGCTSLTTAPVLPATALTDNCYYEMFRGCTSLTEAPVLPATALTQSCYTSMFYGCTSLSGVPSDMLPATTLAERCYTSMFNGCTSLTEAPELPATTLAGTCYSYMFNGCTSLTTAPELPATALTNYCYSNMFNGCSSLSYIKCLAVSSIGENSSTSSWVNGVASQGTFVQDASTSWSTGVNGIPNGWTVHTDIDTNNYITVTALEDNSIFGLAKLSSNQKLYYYDNNNSTWYQITDTGFSVSLESGDTLNLCGKLTGNNSSSNYTQFKTTSGKFNVSGNINSIWNYEDLTQSLKQYCGYHLFMDCTGLVDVSGLTSPADTLASYCYSYMFEGCTSLTTAPELPATTLAQYCYYYMFRGCTSLTEAPELPATTLAQYCYYNMFYGCTSLSGVPSDMLPATTLAERCYYNMFNGCTSLTEAPELPATTLASGCYQSMFYGCTSLTEAPELPATALTNYCYSYMFSGCASLSYIKCLAVSGINTNSSTSYWVNGVASSGIFIKHPDATSWTTGINGIPDGWLEPDDIIQYNPTTAFSPVGSIEFEVQSDNTLFGISKKSTNQLLYISKNNSNWMELTGPSLIELSSGETIYACGRLTGDNSSSDYMQFAIFGDVAAIGNVNSIWNYEDLGQPLNQYCGYRLFRDCQGLVNSGLTLPATALTSYCYYEMFRGCTSLTEVPELPATTLASYCYSGMFRGCTSLTEAPVLPATALTDNCYEYMFNGCKSLTEAPVLPATTLTQYCYSYMFYGCTSLVEAPVLPATALTDYCYSYMFSGCASLTTAPVLPATTLADHCYSYMFSGCASLVETPELPATTLAQYCYSYMFYGCKSLTEAPELPATTLANYCYYYMFRGCTSLTEAPVLPATALTRSCYYNMFEGCTSLTEAPVLPATALTRSCYSSMFEGCTSLTKAPELPATTLADNCYEYMFYGCTSLTEAPELPATTLASGCYYSMFYGCSSLNHIKCLAVSNISMNYPYFTINGWLIGVASTGVFEKNPSVSESTWGRGPSGGIPSNWRVQDAVIE